MRSVFFTIVSQNKLADKTYELVLEGDTSSITTPGSFVQIELPGFFLRRPISVCSWTEHSLTLIYKVVGVGTTYMATLSPGDILNVLTGLGNGYNIFASGTSPLIVGGGAGVAPLYGLAEALIQKNIEPMVILGFNTQREIYYKDHFEALGLQTKLCTVDGSFGTAGFVTAAMQDLKNKSYSYVYSCGPFAMLKAVYRASLSPGEYSLEERMGCGFGACMGCSIQTLTAPKRVCKEGPVFFGDDIIWDL